MPPRLMLAILVAPIVPGSAQAEVLDRIAVTVGRHVIAESAIIRDLRVSAFLDGKPADLSAAARRKSAGRLVDQVLILQEAADSHVTLSVDQDLAKALAGVRARFSSDAEYQAELKRYNITEKDVSAQLAEGLRELEFTNLRFGPEVQISDQDLRAYYDQLAAGWREKNPARVPSFEESRDQVQQLLTGQKLNEALDKWLGMMRDETQIAYRPQVIQ